MNFNNILKMQKELDKAYTNDGIVLPDDSIDNKRILAILVEIGEFANEYAPFKYWKKQKNVEKEKVLEEFVDGIHFFSTMFNNAEVKLDNITPKIIDQDKSIQLLHTFKGVIKIFENMSPENIINAFRIYLGNAELLGFTENEIKDAYINKNKINYERIKNGY